MTLAVQIDAILHRSEFLVNHGFQQFNTSFTQKDAITSGFPGVEKFDDVSWEGDWDLKTPLTGVRRLLPKHVHSRSGMLFKFKGKLIRVTAMQMAAYMN